MPFGARQLLISASLLVLGLLSALFLLRHSLPPNSSGPARTYTITLTDRGFQPDSLTIRTGDTIRFVSAGTDPFWPASNPHPIHTLYPAFDPRYPIAGNASWSFTFDTPGTWGYHDHLAPAFSGTIIVTAPGQAEGGDVCTRRPHTSECWRSVLLGSVEAEGVKAALQKLAELYQTEPGFPAACHGLAHDIGVASYRRYLADPNSAYTPDSTYCASGFYHGFMEAMLTATKEPQQAKAFCTSVGVKLGVQTPDAELQCYHGIGHGAMDFAIGKLLLASSTAPLSPQMLIDPALALCRSVSTSEPEMYRCGSAVFNSLSNLYLATTSRSEFNLAIDQNDPLRLCREYPSDLQDSCYGNFNSLLFFMTGKNLLAAARYVERIPDDVRAESAMDYLANLSTIYTARENPAAAVAVCRQLQERLRLPCIRGFAHGFLENGEPGKEGNEALAFCGLALLHADERKACYTYVLTAIHGWFSPAQSSALCASAPSEYQPLCAQK